MRKTVNTVTLIYFIWLLLDALNIPGMLFNFLLIGEIPFMHISLPPTTMLAFFTASGFAVILEIMSHRVESVRRIRHNSVRLFNR